jgi:hydroxymethylglutaryl-CoA lyase
MCNGRTEHPVWSVAVPKLATIDSYGFEEVALADTAGIAGPAMIYDTMSSLIGTVSGVRFRLHLHDTRRMGLVNVTAGLQAGVVEFDSSIAGLGGCPYAPGASGNMATEDRLNMLLGCSADGDLTAVLECARKVSAVVRHVDSAVLRAGTSNSSLGRT